MVCSYHRQDDQSGNNPHGHISEQLHQLVPAGRKLGREKITPPIFSVIVSASNSGPVFAVNTRGREFGFRLIVSNQDAEQRGTELPLVEKEDIHGSYAGHDPYQPAHVAHPGPQLPQHQPEDTHQYVH